MDGKYTLTRDSWNRVQADISPDVSVAIKVLAETDARRIEKQTHAYAVLDIRTDFGPIRIRDVRIQWSVQNERFFIRWRQWSTGRMRDGRKEYLDVAGPLDPDTRSKFADAILDLFAQIKEEAAQGTLGRANVEALNEVRAQIELAAIASQASADEAPESVEGAEIEASVEPVAEAAVDEPVTQTMAVGEEIAEEPGDDAAPKGDDIELEA